MSTYAIGDIQGCLGPFEALLERIRFKADRDQLVLAGDLVNRGPDSLGTLRRIHDLRDNVLTVLGNHDLHLLAVAHGQTHARSKDTLAAILEAKDRDTLLDWLQRQPLLIDLPEFNAVMAHAGMPPLWSLEQARERAGEITAVLADGEQASTFFAHMYGNEPAGWRDDLQGPERWRVITNHFTRMRFVNDAGELDLGSKGEADQPPEGYMPWFEHPRRRDLGRRILFGHWAALEGRASANDVEPLDTGCVWGGQLTALRLEDGLRIACQCR
ncbi:symmetrical bis(5'-nucleosyl)-tetraphosphatase [Alloalcanivorax xenomutans]|jgi:bis(5'-nucleosyl)-tetraphosphatase (symmetrical)|uniref:symmetrical bis(5'-nucleosyl)-tetraphosphatase n=1 Tax=Alloalcanivorax xenomutans TaxID=1094342 RepID=UPI0003B8DB7E|nr:symmetrical bis(5'-nucleosyl)-tetraphosphatase [Alloalcanivorax xenomutans]ERS14944.1 diadenosine tetraphosphatase [Alcanivorax sp. PN-3]KYZ86648.1 diadenosine tetraphosphatase [Alcanivorax sp. KX64203]WOA32422.1 symmetrical bis(5'-nucleosyl)-tetraphosphatase [Alloalcanivorax xenomutans]WOD29385.1 symmetrical bis(5'-nucleosyl)-tetraphosphatase [Alloalcanivorax xenomutans]CUR46582.1 Bis(5'-nucleosyl)-tetraphosphatase, symmetrical [Alloalcanivorax xenomutans]